jgi:hypothetical protein
MKDIHSDLRRIVAIGNAVLSADTTPTNLDLQGYDAAEILLDIGIGGITFSGVNRVDFVLTHSDDGTTFAPVTNDDMLGVTGITSGIIRSLVAAHPAPAVYRYGYKGGRRFLRLLADFSGTHATGTPIAASILLAHGHDNPQANQA